MNKTTKKIITREGLVILVVAIIGLLYVSPPVAKLLTKPPITEEAQKTIERLDKFMTSERFKQSSYLPFKAEVYDIMKDLKAGLLSQRDLEIINKYLDGIKIPISLVMTVDEKIRFRIDTVLFFFILAYPLYLLIRLILWAMRTLREK
jgi:hypothetical protein